ncbi:MAG: sll0787 family AIR synthase-like protein [Beijerinckiaceae bacterium]|nr:sll0787 family AIR synthase-like protein [Beijerinckiaceae bacterium]
MSILAPSRLSLRDLRAHLLSARGFAHKLDISAVAAKLGLSTSDTIPFGDDCAAIPDGSGYLLFAIEGFLNDFVAAEPYFAGYCGVMVNLSDIAAMGGRPIAVVDAIWSEGEERAAAVLEGLRAASEIYGVPIVGGHTNSRNGQGQLAVAVLGRANRLITSFGAQTGDVLLAAVDFRGGFRGQSLNWDASTGAPPERLRGDLEILPELAESGLVTAGKDISMAGLVGSAMMLLEASGRGARIDVDAIPRPAGVALERFLLAFPSFGFVLTVKSNDADDVVARFDSRGISCAAIGTVDDSHKIRLRRDGEEVELWDFANPFIGGSTTRDAGRESSLWSSHA